MRKSESKSKISSEKKGFLVILSAPSGCGKTTILSRLLTRHPDWIKSISVTTREPRLGEEKGKDYEFVSPSQFQSFKRGRQFLEWAKIFDHYYGTKRKAVESLVKGGKTVVLTIDIQGTRTVRRELNKKIPFFSIFILPPSIPELRARLEKRETESRGEIERRIKRAQEEIKAAREYDATVINHDLDQTVREVEGLISAFKNNLKR